MITGLRRGRAGAVRTTGGHQAPAGADGDERDSRVARTAVWRLAALLRAHWLMAVLLAAGLALRVLALIAYRPALLYIDSMRYLYNAYPGADPVGYKVPLFGILLAGDLTTVAAVQHLAGLAMAVTLYLVLQRAGAARWLAAIAAAPVLLDGYQLQIEQTIMPDVWFEVLIVAAIAILLWRRAVTAQRAAVAGLLLGASATVRQVGEILVLPALLFLVVASAGWTRRLACCAALTAGFALPVLGYCAGSYEITGHFWLASATPSDSTYGRMAAAADCATLRLPVAERALCPTPHQQAYGPDWLDHYYRSPLKMFRPPAGVQKYALVADFNKRVLLEQPGRVLGAVAMDAVKLFAVTRTSGQGGTPILRWQFQDYYPVYTGADSLSRSGVIVLHLRLASGGGQVTRHPLDPSYGGKPAVIRPVAAFLRGYQLHGGYAPGPLMLLFALTGLAGSVAAFGPARRAVGRRRAGHGAPGARAARSRHAAQGPPAPAGATRRRDGGAPVLPDRRQLALACLLCYAVAVAILLASDVFQFSWRYQLPALVTVPPAGALGIAVLLSYLPGRRAVPAAPGSRSG